MRVGKRYVKTAPTVARQSAIKAEINSINAQIKCMEALQSLKLALEEEDFALELDGLPPNVQSSMIREKQIKANKEKAPHQGTNKPEA
jgi:hypothetical protein